MNLTKSKNLYKLDPEDKIFIDLFTNKRCKGFCNRKKAVIMIHSYSKETLWLCLICAKSLKRILTQDIEEQETGKYTYIPDID